MRSRAALFGGSRGVMCVSHAAISKAPSWMQAELVRLERRALRQGVLRGSLRRSARSERGEQPGLRFREFQP